MCSDDIKSGNKNATIAELGVFQGEFVVEMGKCIEKNKFYLFDTFEGLPQKDVILDQKSGYSSAKVGHFANTTIKEVLSKIHNNQRCVVREGYFPRTVVGIEDEFCFVN